MTLRIKKLPSMRKKKRYLTFWIHTEAPVIYSEMKGAVLNSILNWMGEEGFSKAGARIIRNLWNEREQTGWISTSLETVDDVKMALALIHQIGDGKVIFQTLRVSGTIKSGKDKLGLSGK
jgi:RNase P/RNase MRP subunit POP5